jgi:hypothetical protein
MNVLSTIFGALLVVGGLFVVGFVALLVLILKSAVNKEAEAVLPATTRSLIDRARKKLPEEARPRWEEEWPAGFDLAIEKRPIWALREAISLYRGARNMARAYEPAPARIGRGRPLGDLGSFLATGAGGLVGSMRSFLRLIDQFFDALTDLSDWVFESVDRAIDMIFGARRKVAMAAFLVLSIAASVQPFGQLLSKIF